jgi:hypothetical protein
MEVTPDDLLEAAACWKGNLRMIIVCDDGGWSPVGGLDRVDAFDDARPEAFTSINGEAGSDNLREWLPCLMITGQANRQSFKCSLAGSHHSVGACDMPDHEKLTTRAKHTVHLLDCCCRLGDAAEGKRADDGIEPVVSEWEVLGVGLDEGDVNTEFGCPAAGYLQHGRAEVDPRQLDSSRVEGQVPAGTDCDLQYLAGRLRTRPRAAIPEQQQIVKARVAVVAWRVPFP